MALRAEEIG